MQKLTRFLRLAILFALLPSMLVTCKKDPVQYTIYIPKPVPNDSFPQFELVTNIITGDSVSVSWKKPVDPHGLPVTFDISMDNLVISKDQTIAAFNLGRLQPLRLYHLKITARDSLKKSTISRLTFTTLSGDAKLIHGQTVCEGRQREYGYYLPSGIAGTTPPLLVYLHGAGGIAWPELVTSGFREIAEREKFILVMPQALKGTISGESCIQWNAHEALAWDDALFINALVDSLVAKYTVNTHKIYVSGMSNGGFMTFYLASRTDRFAAIAPMSGLISYNIYNHYLADWPMPLLYIHGTADSIVRYNGDAWMPSVEKVMKFWTRNNGCDTMPVITELPNTNYYDGSTVTLFNYVGRNPRSEIRFYRINGGGHSVAGYEPGSNQDIQSYEVIWDFFKEKSRFP